MTRHFGWDDPANPPPKAPSTREVTAYLLDRALRAQGIVSLDSICHLDAPSKAAIRRLIEARVRAKELVPVTLEGAGKQEHWARPEALASTPAAAPPELVHILSPFDPLAIQRKRTELFLATATASRPMSQRRSGCSAISRCRYWSATTSWQRLISRPIARRASS